MLGLQEHSGHKVGQKFTVKEASKGQPAGTDQYAGKTYTAKYFYEVSGDGPLVCAQELCRGFFLTDVVFEAPPATRREAGAQAIIDGRADMKANSVTSGLRDQLEAAIARASSLEDLYWAQVDAKFAAITRADRAERALRAMVDGLKPIANLLREHGA